MEEEKVTETAGNAEMDINADADVPGTTHLSNPDTGEGTIEKLQAEVEEQKDKYLRLFAEFDNFRRRNARERLELVQTAGKDVITALLEVLDDCDRAEKQMQESQDAEQLKQGTQLIFNKLRHTLQSRGLKAMESIDTEFDVEKHEAITEVPAGEEKKGKVVDEVEKGYYLNDKLIRFAKVVVGS
jgi:molecular chaperone GrpE